MCKQCSRQRPHWWLFPLYSTRYAGLASQYGAREAPMRKATTTASIENNSSSSMQDVSKQAESQSQSNIQSDISRTAKESERACKTRAASIVHTGPKLTFPFASSLLVAALLHAVKVFVPVLSGEVFPPAIYAKEAIGTAGHIEAHLIYGCLFVGVCPGAAFQRHQRWEQPREPSDPRGLVSLMGDRPAWSVWGQFEAERAGKLWQVWQFRQLNGIRSWYTHAVLGELWNPIKFSRHKV